MGMKASQQDLVRGQTVCYKPKKKCSSVDTDRREVFKTLRFAGIWIITFPAASTSELDGTRLCPFRRKEHGAHVYINTGNLCAPSKCTVSRSEGAHVLVSLSLWNQKPGHGDAASFSLSLSLLLSLFQSLPAGLGGTPPNGSQ